MSQRRPYLREAAIVTATAIVLGLGAVSTTSQAKNDVVGEWDFFVACFDKMINNTPKQVRDCDPKVNVINTTNPSLSTPVAGAPLLPTSSSSTTTSSSNSGGGGTPQ
jgi:hypothetical protein